MQAFHSRESDRHVVPAQVLLVRRKLLEGEQKNYYQGCLWGGQVKHAIPMMKTLRDRVDKDYENDIIAVWHDESQINKFFLENEDKVNALPPDYAYPECFPHYTYDRKIIHLAKDNSTLQT